MILRSLARFGLLLAAITVFSGCSHYQLGTGGKLAFSTLYVEPVENKTLLPQARAILSTQIREALVRDGRVQLVNSASAADATLQVTVRDYHRDVASVRENDTGLARKFTLTLEVACTLRDNRGGKDLFTDRLVNVQRDAFTDGGQLQSEYQTLPLLAQALADKVTHAVLDVWWMRWELCLTPRTRRPPRFSQASASVPRFQCVVRASTFAPFAWGHDLREIAWPDDPRALAVPA